MLPAAPYTGLSKLAAPEPSRVHPRHRLFRELDAARRRGNLAWIAAPAGSGKTTLVASYLQARRLRAAWYQVDPADGDVASFFFYLAQLAGVGGDDAADSLPAFTAEYLGGLPAFSRNWFRRFYRRLDGLRVLVFDDYHLIDADSPVHIALREGLAELPRGLAVIVASRLEPPPALTRLRTLEGFTLLDRNALRLTEDESVEVARRRLGAASADEFALRTLHRRTQGWLAGLVLMLEHGPEALSAHENAPVDPPVFDYFAGELFSQSEPRLQQFLVRAALLPRPTPQTAALLTGMEDAADLLAELDRRNFFIVRHRAEQGWSYEFHPLFRRFLLEQGRQRLAPEELLQIKRQAASLLADNADVVSSLALLRETGDWGRIVSVVLAQAPELLRKGRFQTLDDWIGDIPASYRTTVPWLEYFLGLCRLPFDPPQARERLAGAYAAFREKGHATGEYLAWAGVIDTFIYAWSDFHPADPWIEEFDALRTRHPQFPSGEIEVRAVSAIFAILMYRRPQDPRLGWWAARVDALLSEDIDPAMRMVAANHLVLYYHWWIGRVDAGNEVVRRMEPFAGTRTVGPFVRLAWDAIRAIANWMSADNAAALATVERGLALADETGAHLWDFMLIGQGVFAAATGGDLERARSFLHRMQASITGERRLDGVQYHFACFQEAVHRNDLEAMRRHARAGNDCAVEAGVLWGEAYTRPALAQVRFLEGDFAGTRRELDAAMRIARQIGCSNARYYVHELQAQFAEARGDADARVAAVRALFGVMREQGFVNSAWWRSTVMSRLCCTALEHDIEIEFVRRLIRLRSLQPEGPAARLEHWPWPVRLATFGGLRIEIDGQPLHFAGKVQKRPLGLLKALIAFGGTTVDEAQLTEALWPDAEGDDAHNAFATALQRLRKLLGHREALLLQDGKLSLNPKLCRLDTWVFESVDLQTGDAEDLRRATLLYDSAFLANDDASWAIAPRERLRARFVRAALALADRHAAEQRWEQAVGCLEGALQVDDAVESFYQQLMRFQARLGRGGDVRRTYLRCREVLASRLQAVPSPSTEALLKSLGTSSPGLAT